MDDDANKKELKEKVSKLVKEKFKGKYLTAFQYYDKTVNVGKSANLTLNKDELRTLLEDADVGNRVTRGTWADGIIKELDKDGDGCISWKEFENAMTK